MAMQLPELNLSTNLAIFGIIGLVVVYGMMAGHAKVRNLALSTYVGIVLANQLGHGLYEYANKSGHGSFSEGVIKLVLFIAPVVLLEFSRRHHSRGAHSGMVVALILSVLTAGLIIGMGLGQLEGDSLKHITDSSIIAYEMHTYRLWLVALVPLFIVAEAFIGPGRSEKH
jgi:hypothetical protein